MESADRFHALTVQESLTQLDTTWKGLTEEQVQQRLEQYGPNFIETEKRVSKLALLLAQLKNPLVLVLVAAAIISLIADHAIDAVVIGVVIVVNSLIGFFQEYRAETALDALRSRSAPEANVLRNCPDKGGCVETRIKAAELVPGDVVLLEAGDKVPADARIVEAINLEIDEAMLTGESLAVAKTADPLPAELVMAEWRNVAFSGTIVTYGRGKAVVFATGAHTEIGKIAGLIQETEKAESPLQRQTANLGKSLGLLALVVSVVTLLLGLLRGLEWTQVFLYALASAISSIPEGLPAVMTITLAIGVNRMAQRNAIIRRLPAVDTLGAATVICTDKTGTLTTNQMTVQRISVNGRLAHVSGVGFEPRGDIRVNGAHIDVQGDGSFGLALRAAALCNDAHLVRAETNDAHWEVRGDPTEGALVVAAEKVGLNKEELDHQYPRIDEIPFSSQLKYMATFHQISDERVDLYAKGAPETILDMCSQRLGDNGPEPLTAASTEQILQVNTDLAADALRVLGLACRSIAPQEVEEVKAGMQNGQAELTFVGLMGMLDPPRPEVPAAVAQCQRAGIRVIMATGDHQLTGKEIARRVGILQGDEGVVTGAEMERMSDQELDALIEETRVFARVSPAHKHRIVESLQRHGHVVAMTGDGVNDAPALQAAEIGVAMGITGTDVTKETADMVLADDNFASIVSAVEEGRVVFQNVRKVVKFLLSTNIGEDLTLLGALALIPDTPLLLTAVQILWVNLVTDGLLDITIAMEPKEADVMEDPPRKRTARIIDSEILLNAAFVALFMAAGTLGLFVWAKQNGNLAYAQTIAFTTLAMFQVFNALNVRSRTRSLFQVGLFTNQYLIGALALSVILQVLATLVPFLQVALGTVPLTPGLWGRIVLVASSVFVAVEIRKWVVAWWRGRAAA
ncbi:MAG: HAD-IC family P-type ATPase [Anaerolineae bacterium]|nr:HAD-IC family P-type ATPase [Anaerolineae bacterium]